jgi:competence protein ComEC
VDPARRALTAYFFDVGQGDATLLAGPDCTIVIDAGRHDRNDVVPLLRSAGVQSIDLLIGTHPHADHIGQFPQILEAFAVREVWMSGESHTSRTFERALDATLSSGAAYHEPRAGESYRIGSVLVEVLHPAELSGDFNDSSVGVRISFGQVALVFTGDAERHAEHQMIARGHALSAQILQLGHHGSRTSSTPEFLHAVRPEVAIYSAGEGNSYGHPHDEVLQRLSQMGIPVLGTDRHGTIRVTTDGSQFQIATERGVLMASPPREPVYSR